MRSGLPVQRARPSTVGHGPRRGQHLVLTQIPGETHSSSGAASGESLITQSPRKGTCAAEKSAPPPSPVGVQVLRLPRAQLRRPCRSQASCLGFGAGRGPAGRRAPLLVPTGLCLHGGLETLDLEGQRGPASVQPSSRRGMGTRLCHECPRVRPSRCFSTGHTTEWERSVPLFPAAWGPGDRASGSPVSSKPGMGGAGQELGACEVPGQGPV